MSADAGRQMASRYVELTRYLHGNNDWERRYYGFVFNAIAVGEVWASRPNCLNKNNETLSANGAGIK
jgi:hypothetical protein